jgi:DNA-binding response OmpR family regulator
LVVDDVDQMRTLIRRALAAGGYEVDTASTLAEARGMDPAAYDAVLVDANLGPDRGLDLIEALQSQNPAAVGRCLVITGGAVDMVPDGVAVLTKPFQLGDLLEVVRGLCQPDVAAPPDHGGIAPDPGVLPVSALPGNDNPAADKPPAWRLLDVTRRIRIRERRELTDFLHDGPIQELTAATLELQMLRRSAPPDQVPRLAAVQQLVEATAGSLRWLVDGPWPFARPETRLAAALQQRIGWLLSEPVTLDSGEQLTEPAAIDVPVVVDLVELMCLELAPENLVSQANVAVRAQTHQIEVQLTLTAAAEADQAIGDPVRAKRSLAELASALRASSCSDFCDRLWRAQLILPRQPAQASPRAEADLRG